MRILALPIVVAVSLATSSLLAQSTGFGTAVETKGPRLDKKQTSRYQIGMVVHAEGGPCQGMIGTASVPLEWPEQEVKVVAEDFSPYVKNVSYRMIGNTVRQMVVNMPAIPPGEDCRAVITFEVTRSSILPPEDTSVFVLPNAKKLKSDVRIYLGPSPYIEPTHAKLKALAKELLAGKETAWEKVEALYDGTRERVTFENGPLKSASQTLKDGKGAAEELCSVFISLCRGSDIPARMVWVPQHCYAEFYLEDKEGKGYWIPCQVAGNREFGGILEHRPILQKGDNFLVPERPRERQRYVAEFLTGSGGTPKCQFIRDAVDSGM